ncbi:MAG: flippase-like domain-containing protein [Chitinophagaceae bacterium]|nr:flippase-like domain-containing protein [Chitinophagaceae bacterium]
MAFARRWLFLPLMQLNKNIEKFINYFLAPLLLAWLLFFIYRQLLNQPNLAVSWLTIKRSLYSYNILYLIASFLLMFVNWGLEAVKWKLSIADVQRVSFLQSFKAVLSGVSFTVTTPNRVGEYLGRILYLPSGKRLKTIPVTLIGSLSQILITFTFGCVSFISLRSFLLQTQLITSTWHMFISSGLSITMVIMTLLYFNVAGVMHNLLRWLRNSRYRYLFEGMRVFNQKLLMQLLLFSFARYVTFMTQYFMLFKLYGVNIPVATLWMLMSLVFLVLAVIPTIVLAEIGLRGEITLQLVGLFTSNSLAIIATSVTVWLINLIIPAIAGALFILGVKVLKQNERKGSSKVFL